MIAGRPRVAVLAAFTLALGAQAQPLPSGQNLSVGDVSHGQLLMAGVANPAAAAAMPDKEGGLVRLGLLNAGAGYEIGDIDDLFAQIDSTQAQLVSAQDVSGLITGNPTADAAAVADHLNTQVIAPLNVLMRRFEQDARLTVFGGAYLPFTPVTIARKGWGGGVVVEASANLFAAFSYLADPLAQISATDPAILDAVTPGSPNFGAYTLPANDSTLIVKAAVMRQFALSYARTLYGQVAEGGQLDAGLRLKYYQVELSRSATRLVDSIGAQDTFDLGRSYTASSAWGADLGALWRASGYRVGGWVQNLNTPRFSYNDIDTTAYTSAAIKAALQAETVYEMKPQLRLEGGLHTADEVWSINLGLDANAVADPVGREFQWATVGLVYASDSWWLPSARLGYRANQAGSRLNYITAGLTLFKVLSLDVAATPQTVSDNNGQSAPRSAMATLGLQLTF